MMNTKFFALILLLCLILPPALALPTTNAVTGITSKEVTFNAAGGAGVGCFRWGQISGGPYYWSTPNQSVSGVYTDYQFGPPMLTGKTYYVVACDSTGCGNEVSFNVPVATGINQTHFGTPIPIIMRSGFNITESVPYIVYPYTATMTAPIAWGMLFFFIFTGMWLRPKDIFLPCMLAIVIGGAMIFNGDYAMGIPMKWASIGQGLIYAAIAGLIFSWFTH